MIGSQDSRDSSTLGEKYKNAVNFYIELMLLDCKQNSSQVYFYRLYKGLKDITIFLDLEVVVLQP